MGIPRDGFTPASYVKGGCTFLGSPNQLIRDGFGKYHLIHLNFSAGLVPMGSIMTLFVCQIVLLFLCLSMYNDRYYIDFFGV